MGTTYPLIWDQTRALPGRVLRRHDSFLSKDVDGVSEMGSSLNIWHDSWLKNNDNLKLLTPIIEGLKDLRVQDLLKPGSRDWDIELLDELFYSTDVNAIVRTPLVSHDSQDRLIWHYAKNGIYSVKSGYRIAMNNNSNTVQNMSNFPRNWSAIWNQTLPPRIKLFLWGACIWLHPSPRRLERQRGMQLNPRCPLCNREPETVHHALLSCDRIRAYYGSNTVEINHIGSSSFVEACFSSLNRLSKEKFKGFGTIAWIVWK